MSMTLTQWWSSLEADLNRLQGRVGHSQTQAWQVARTIASRGAKIESNLLWANGHKDAIDQAMPGLGSAFTNPHNQSIHYLPDVNNSEELLFAIVYYNHLCRYSQIDSGIPLVLNGVIAERNAVEADAQELKSRIDNYLAQQNSPAEFLRDFPDVAAQPGRTLFEQIVEMLAGLPIEEKLIIQFEADTYTAIDRYRQQDNPVVEVFENLHASLKEKEKILRSIAVFKKMIEELNSEGTTLVDDLRDAEQMQVKYPQEAAQWMSINTADTEASATTKVAINAVRTGVAVSRFLGGAVSYVTKNTLGRVTPQSVNDKANLLVNTLSDVAESLTPHSNADAKKGRLLAKAQEQTATFADRLNSPGIINPQARITARDFESMSSQQIIELADKVATIRYLLDIQKTMELYRQKQNTGIVKVIAADVFGPIVRFLCETPLRRIIYDRILLTLEAESLEKRLAEMINHVKTDAQYGKDQVNSELGTALTRVKTTSEKVLQESLYTFFVDERMAASRELIAVVDRVVSPAADALDDETPNSSPH